MKTETSTETKPVQVAERPFPKYTFFKVDPPWRRVDEQQWTSIRFWTYSARLDRNLLIAWIP